MISKLSSYPRLDWGTSRHAEAVEVLMLDLLSRVSSRQTIDGATSDARAWLRTSHNGVGAADLFWVTPTESTIAVRLRLLEERGPVFLEITTN